MAHVAPDATRNASVIIEIRCCTAEMLCDSDCKSVMAGGRLGIPYVGHEISHAMSAAQESIGSFDQCLIIQVEGRIILGRKAVRSRSLRELGCTSGGGFDIQDAIESKVIANEEWRSWIQK